ncbi:2-phospho-L-lactate guanylyltransferase [Spiractinospora alimapuensis]|uniref:2-phospho-L-lactate guanylyltransferase n=1 Tax=Spiractinospora alimapuensis TaxID=2820884 RepID=UPI001F15A5B5|nr:2-phospho-L-lactate guanylyltransferase [Spiractinospora alimapuensis]
MKLLTAAKSRLSPLGHHRRALALAVACDTVSATVRCDRVARVVVVTDDGDAAPRLRDLGAHIVADDPNAGLNPALAHGAAEASRLLPAAGRAALSADLPALRAADLSRALDAADEAAQSFVADLAGTGTTLYAARSGEEFAPAFGSDSRRRHRDHGVVEITLDGIDSLRRDVDTVDDLRAALVLGVGTATAEAAARAGVSAGV